MDPGAQFSGHSAHRDLRQDRKGTKTHVRLAFARRILAIRGEGLSRPFVRAVSANRAFDPHRADCQLCIVGLAAQRTFFAGAGDLGSGWICEFVGSL